MTVTKLVLMLVCLMSVALQPKDQPKEAKVTPLFSKDLPELPGKEGLMITVEYPPAVQTQSTVTTRMDSFMFSKVPS